MPEIYPYVLLYSDMAIAMLRVIMLACAAHCFLWAGELCKSKLNKNDHGCKCKCKK